MGLFKRVKHMATADLHNFLDKVENPVSMVKQYIRELEEQIGQAQRALSQQYYVERKYELQIEELAALVMKRSRQAELAVERGEDGIAELALEEKLKNQTKLTLYKSQYETIKAQSDLLLEQIKRMKEKYDELQLKKQHLFARISAAQAIQATSSAITPFDADRFNYGLSRIEEQVGRLEANALAGRQVGEVLQAVPASNQLERQEEIQKQLAALKEKKGFGVSLDLAPSTTNGN
ncbi:phage shock protein A [Paenibacillus baekrokdamisoli]|uniref:Phage shock protein A n=1 Tax=Paenibacillus baekrokdamisoli TaxID=1712516 RepID=A0A3G9JJA8_9BACL|nr:PspA/IM30 family protein [Paenibacillus baekrokdamisoli]MBB3071850.1 phage shock protein A [Paenibacillus baekrokdamisoli]BBH24168.1 phage shock protein A [Paenibacillus baekrokdamisoli]